METFLAKVMNDLSISKFNDVLKYYHLELYSMFVKDKHLFFSKTLVFASIISCFFFTLFKFMALLKTKTCYHPLNDDLSQETVQDLLHRKMHTQW